jgi:hypothetical protein
VKGTCKNAISRIECLLDPISVVTIDVHIQNAGERAQKLEDAKHDIIDVTKA